MKKFLLMFLMLFTLSVGTASAQTYTYRSFQFSYKQLLNNGRWTNWSKWENSKLSITQTVTLMILVVVK